ncbi:MAG: sodium/proton-translocating pyrophosphatase [Eubacterium sp.]
MTWTIIIPIIGIIALLVAAGLSPSSKKQSEAGYRPYERNSAKQLIHEGARAFLFAEYKILAIIIVIVFVAVGFAIGWTQQLCCFLIGVVFPYYCRFSWWLTVAAKSRTSELRMPRKEKGMAESRLSVAIPWRRIVMGLCVVGLGLFGAQHHLCTDRKLIHPRFGFSSPRRGLSLLVVARVGGGIYTKAARRRSQTLLVIK